MATTQSDRPWAIFILLIGATLMTGCASTGQQPIYSWGDYQTLVYQMYVHPGKATPAEQVTRLSKDIESAKASDQKVAPGIHAQLGYMAYLDGKPEEAAEQFNAERVLFPESASFMTHVLHSMRTQDNNE